MGDDPVRDVLAYAQPDDPVAFERALSDATRRLFAREPEPVSFGRYVLLECLGRGGGGSVYSAHDPELDRRVAIKLMHPGTDGDRARSEMLREAKALARVTHPNVVGIHDVGTFERLCGQDRSGVYIVMEYVEGQTLRAWQRLRPRRVREVLGVMIGAGRGLIAAHERGLVHRDFKPGNVIIDPEGRARVIDFGLAKPPRSRAEDTSTDVAEPGFADGLGEQLAVVDDGSSASLTGAGWVRGTLAYMPPEQHRGDPVDARGDQYAFCVVLYELLVGVRPFEAVTVEELLARKSAGRPSPPPPRSRVPDRVQRAIARGLDPDPDQRFGSMDELLAVLERARRPKLAIRTALALTAACGASVIAIAAYSSDPCAGGREELAGAWDLPTRAAVESAFQASELPIARETWEIAEHELDAYADEWLAVRESACRTAVSAGIVASSGPLQCLEHDAAALRGLTTVLQRGDPQTILHAPELVTELQRPRDCLDDEVRAAPHTTLADATQLAEVDAWLGSARHDEARVAIDRLRAGLSANDHRTSAAVGLRDARLLRVLRHDLAAEAAARRALYEAERADDDEAAATAMIELVLVTGEYLGRTDEALRIAEHVAARLDRGRAEESRTILLHAAVARTQLAAGLPAQAQVRLQFAVREAQAGLDPRDPLRAEIHNLLGVAYDRQNATAEALEHYEIALEIRTARLGPSNPSTATALGNRGVILARMGRYDEAIADLRRAVEANRRALGPDHPGLAWTIDSLAFALDDRGDPEQALPLHRRALELRERALGPDHPEVARSHDALAYSLNLQGRPDLALEHATRCVAIRERAPGHPDLADALYTRAIARHGLGDHAGALQDGRRGLAILEAALGREDPKLAGVLRALGICEIEVGNREGAVEALTRVRVLAQAGGVDATDAALATWALARALPPEIRENPAE